MVLLLMVMRRERSQESKNNKKREGSKRARQVPIHSLTPDRPPLAATTMLIYYYPITTRIDIHRCRIRNDHEMVGWDGVGWFEPRC